MTPRTAPQLGECKVCGRQFLSHNCTVHCGNGCCRASKCENARQDYKTEPAERIPKCVVCHKVRHLFEPFAPCTEDCTGGTYYQSSRAEPGTLGQGVFSRRRMTTCHLLVDEDLTQRHRPAEEPRIHIKYCSLRCYNSLAFGHETRRLVGNRRRSRFASAWRNKQRTENGYFRDYQRRRKQAQDELMRYGTVGSADELRAGMKAKELAQAAADDPDFMEIFGDKGTGA